MDGNCFCATDDPKLLKMDMLYYKSLLCVKHNIEGLCIKYVFNQIMIVIHSYQLSGLTFVAHKSNKSNPQKEPSKSNLIKKLEGLINQADL